MTTTTTTDTQTTKEQETTKRVAPEKRLGLIWDIDGTLIAEGERIRGTVKRPGVVEFLRWLVEERGHAAALWTAGWSGHAENVSARLCRAVQGDDHACPGVDCGRTFDFVWDQRKLRQGREVKVNMHDLDACRWCDMYSRACDRCECWQAACYCPCRYTKDLHKVWHDPDQETARFVKERTLIVENTPQQCIWNYGNAVYVPTYRGSQLAKERELFERLKLLVLELEEAESVRTVRKCDHERRPHACFEQRWWDYPLQCVEITAPAGETTDSLGGGVPASPAPETPR